eukprot:Phypoly_transcript_04538.p1 GENE.Phypoly_transcript_04538~~Phypoly_transcript_04538.p1  ORF type:complete len:602 (-),score=82.40 Phypoly_transcript_04538:276-2081(-)
MAQSVKRVVGLKNLGNTCYLNSVLQSLASSSSLRKYLEYGRNTHGKQPLTEALHETIEELNNQHAQVHAVEPPRSLLKVPPISAMLNTKEQQDAHELMQLIMNILDDEHSPHVSSGLKSLSTPKTPPKPLSILRSNPITSPFKQSFPPTFVNRAKGEVELVKLRAHQENPFSGLMATTKKCTSCGSESLPHYQKFYGISLSIPENQCNAEECTLYKCLDRFTTTQMVEDVEWVHQRTIDAHSPPSPANSQLSPQPSLVAGYATFESANVAAAVLPFDIKQDPNLYGCSPPKNTTFAFPKHPSPHHYAILGSSPPKSFSPPKYPTPTKSIRSITPPKFPQPTLVPPATPTTSITLPSISPKPLASTSTMPSLRSAPIPIPSSTASTTNPIAIPTNSTPIPIPANKSRNISHRPSHPPPPKDRACASGRCTALLNVTIARPPLSLCLHLRRLVVASSAQPTFIKLDTHIQFPIMLDLASYCGLGIDITSGLSTKPQAPINKLEYRLIAVIVHSGGAYGGHFTVYRRLDSPGSSAWADISDDLQKSVDEQKVLESEAYMLYYEREREYDEEPIDNTSLLSNINAQITSGLCFGVQHTLNGLQAT